MRVILKAPLQPIYMPILAVHIWKDDVCPCITGTPRNQLSSCFLVAMKDDSIEGIFDTIKHCASISKVRLNKSCICSATFSF